MIQKLLDHLFLLLVGVLVIAFMISSALYFLIDDLINDLISHCS